MITKWLDMSSDPQNPPSKWTLLHALKDVAKMCQCEHISQDVQYNRCKFVVKIKK